MPVISGHDLLRELRESHPEFAAMPFVILSALASREDQVAGHRLGADNYLAKPVDYELMHAVINVKLRQAVGMKPPSIAARAGEIGLGDVYALVEAQGQALSRLLEVVEKIAPE